MLMRTAPVLVALTTICVGTTVWVRLPKAGSRKAVNSPLVMRRPQASQLSTCTLAFTHMSAPMPTKLPLQLPASVLMKW